MADNQTFDAVALWGAITGTGALIWDYVKWQRSQSHFAISVQPDRQYYEAGGILHPGTKILIVVQNRSDKPTTITNVGGVVYSTWFHQKLHRILRNHPNFLWMGKGYRGFVILRPITTHTIPFRLEVGAEWIGMFEQTAEMEAFMKQRLFVLVYHSNQSDPLRCRVKRFPAPPAPTP